MLKKVIRSGNSLAVTIPARFVKDQSLKKGDRVEVETDKSRNRIIYKFFGSTQLTLIKKR